MNSDAECARPIADCSSKPALRAGPRVAKADATDAALHRARESTRTVLEISRELIVVCRDGHILYANPTLSRVLGVRSDEIVERPLIDFIHVDDRPAIATLEASVTTVTSAGPQEPFGLRWQRRQGGYRTTEAIAAHLDFEGTDAVLIVARDITDRAEFQHQLLQRDRMAAIGTLSAGVAHAINNPLTYLLVNVEHVLRRLRAACASDDPVATLSENPRGGLAALAKSLQDAVDGVNRVGQIVRDLLTFSQGNVEQRGMTDVRGIVESAVQMAWHEMRHRARLVKNLAEVPPVDANAARLGQVFLSLLINAAQAIPESHADRHEIRVLTHADDRGYAVIEVSDTGSGITPEDMPCIFDPFFTTKGAGGTGLGLAISHGTVKALGGEIHVSSVPGRGTTFKVVLPPANRCAAAPSSGHLRAAVRSRLLVIDDERLVGDAIARVLSEDSDVKIVTDAEQALVCIGAGERYDVILCDLMMPMMTGMDLYSELLRIAPKLATRMVFMTGGAFTPRARAFAESVVNECLEKPLDIGKLRRLLARVGKG
ncbi:MAG: ATP-binding protein [Myxococcota bacterium]|nr:ATP-binding protein [Myxococcota bacterium]